MNRLEEFDPLHPLWYLIYPQEHRKDIFVFLTNFTYDDEHRWIDIESTKQKYLDKLEKYNLELE